MRQQGLADVTIRIDLTFWGLFLFLLTAFYYHIMVSFSFGTLALIGCSGLVLCFLCLPRLPQMFTASSFRMLFWVAVVGVVCINNAYLEHEYLVYFFSMPLAIVLAYSLQYSTDWHSAMLKAFRVLLLSHLIFGWVFWLLPGVYASKIIPLFTPDSQSDLMRWSNQHVLMGLTSHYSASGVFCAYGVIYYAASWLSSERKDRDLTMLLLMAVSLMMTQKRGPLLFAVATVAALYFLANRVSIEVMMKFGLIAAAALIFLVLAMIFLPDMQRVLDRFSSDGGDVTSGRGDLFAYALELFNEHKLLGIGWGQYRFMPGSMGLPVHNIYLQILAETGIIGSFFIFSGLFLTMIATIRNILTVKKNAPIQQKQSVSFPLLFSAAVQIFFLLYGLTGNPIYDMMGLYPYFLAIAVNESLMMEAKNNTAASNRRAENEHRHTNLRKNK